MQFGSFSPEDAVGGVLAHAMTLPDGSKLQKGVPITAETASLLVSLGVTSVIAALPAGDDVFENDAATRLGNIFKNSSIRIDSARTGRVNLFAKTDGVFDVDASLIDEFNSVDSSVTIATLPRFSSVNTGRLIATIKIIPYAVANSVLTRLEALNFKDAMSVFAYRAKKVGLIATQLPSLKSTTMDKTRKVLEQRLGLSGSEILHETRIPHSQEELAAAIRDIKQSCDLIIVFGASAISDIGDVIPAAIEEVGGDIIRFGMPVDPGNLLLLADLEGIPVLGAPGCARSSAENGFDWILQRLLADLPVSGDAISRMGVGGLLMETGARPHSRLKPKSEVPKTAAIILAAGQSRRMGEVNKLTAELNGQAVIRHVADGIEESDINSVCVVTGHAPEEVQNVLSEFDFAFVHNSQFQEGLSTSLAAGVASLDEDVSHALILLGDMPFITDAMINQLLEAGKNNPGSIIVSTIAGKRGNPVLWPRVFFEELCSISGDVGARHLIGQHRDMVVEVELGEAAGLDLDTPAALQAAKKRFD